MGKSLVYIAVILFSSLILAIGWVNLSLGSKRIELGPMGLPVSYSCPASLASAHGVDLDSMNASVTAIVAVKKHVQSVEIMVAESDKKQASYLVSVVMNSGNRVQSRMVNTQWQRLDAQLAQTIHRCVDEFMALASSRPERVKNVMLTI